jgi:pimeloyl-ACP methyl ester carboxylesterase
MSPPSPLRRTRPGLGASAASDASSTHLIATDPSSPTWFGPASEPLFGFYHPPRVGSREPRRLAIVLCPPFGYEAMCAHRPYRKLAEQLANAGFPVLRIDYHGTGNSAGDDREPGRVPAWIASIHAAIEHVGQLSGCSKVGLFGARLGACLAALAADSRSDVVALALWGPSLTGNTFLREELAVHKLRAQQRAQLVNKAVTTDQDGEALGFVLTSETTRELKAINLGKIVRAPASALVLTRDTPLQEPRVAKQLEDLGARAICEDGPGYAAMLQTSLPPEKVWQRVERYFDEEDRALPSGSPEARSATPARDAEVLLNPHPHGSGRAGGGTREIATWFGPDRQLFGVLTEDRVRARRDVPVILLLSGGVNPQVGTNRMHTRWARAWAELGFTTLRFDLAGVGDSHARANEPDGTLYTMAAIADVRAAMDHLQAARGASRFMLIGLCSGAFVAFHTALSDPRVSDIALLNLLRFYWNPEDSIASVQAQRRHQLRSVRYYLSAATSREHWEKLLAGRVDAARILELLAQRTVRRAMSLGEYWLRRVSGKPMEQSAAHPLARDFHKLATRGLRSLVIYDGDEPMLDDFQEQLGADVPRLQALGRLQLEVIDGADHIFSPVASQHALTERLTEYLRVRLLHEARP